MVYPVDGGFGTNGQTPANRNRMVVFYLFYVQSDRGIPGDKIQPREVIKQIVLQLSRQRIIFLLLLKSIVNLFYKPYRLTEMWQYFYQNG